MGSVLSFVKVAPKEPFVLNVLFTNSNLAVFFFKKILRISFEMSIHP